MSHIIPSIHAPSKYIAPFRATSLPLVSSWKLSDASISSLCHRERVSGQNQSQSLFFLTTLFKLLAPWLYLRLVRCCLWSSILTDLLPEKEKLRHKHKHSSSPLSFSSHYSLRGFSYLGLHYLNLWSRRVVLKVWSWDPSQLELRLSLRFFQRVSKEKVIFVILLRYCLFSLLVFVLME